MIKKLIKINIRYKENEFVKLKQHIWEIQEKHRERKNIKILYIHSEEEQVYNIGLTTYSFFEDNLLTSLKKEIFDWNFDIVSPFFPEFLLIFNYNLKFDRLIKMHLNTVLDLDDSQINYFVIEDALVLEYSSDKGELSKTIHKLKKLKK